MLIPNQMTKVRWHSLNKEYYTSRGYIYTKMGEEFDVKVEDLPLQSHSWVKVKCDFCGKIIDVKYQNYNNRGKYSDGYACKNCVPKKQKNSIRNKYGVDFIFQVPEVKEKHKNVLYEKYNVYYVGQIPGHNEKIRKTSLERYGKDYYTQTEEYKENMKKHNLEKYGVPYHTQAPEVKMKILKSFELNGTEKISKPQLELYNKLVELYNSCELNKSCVYYSLDCVIEVNKFKIDVEFDGEYWHKNRKQQDAVRDKFVKSQGYKILRIKGNRKIPSDNEIIESVDILTKTKRDFVVIKTDFIGMK